MRLTDLVDHEKRAHRARTSNKATVDDVPAKSKTAAGRLVDRTHSAQTVIIRELLISL